MDVFIEKIVKKKSDAKSKALTILIIVGVLILSIVALGIPFLGMFGIFIVVGLIYGAWILITSFQVEYEYSLTNGELDIDSIIAQRRRKRILTINCKEFELLAPFNESHKRETETPSLKKKIYACTSLDAEGLYFAIFNTTEFGKTLLVFEPDDRMLASFKSYIPRKVMDN